MSVKNVVTSAANILKVWGICAGSLFLACTNLQNVAGGIEGGNTASTISGHIADTAGVPLANVRVMLLPSAYNPVTGPAIRDSSTDTTDASGNYSISAAQPGSFTIEAIDNGTKGYRSLVTGISVPKNDTMLVQNAVARIPGRIIFVLPPGIDSVNGYLYVSGTTIYSLVSDNVGSVALDSVPADVNVSVYYGVKGSSALPQLVRDSVVVAPGGVTTIAYAGWNFSKKLFLNTTASGADIAGSVLNFPVLIRLTNENFNFADAKSGGEDLRLAKSDGTLLSYEIERWDASLRSAEIWVKVDTIFGNDSTHFITMYWGNSQAKNVSCDSCVFSKDYGWGGVWHLAEGASDSGVVKGAFRNSVENTNHGDDSAKLTDRTGIIGKGQAFLGADSTRKGDKIVVPGATSRLKPQQLTLSAWVKVGKIDVYSSEIASMGDNYLLRIGSKSGNPLFILYWGSDTDRVICGDSLNDLRDSTWHCIVGSFDGATLRLYVDGELRNSVQYTGTIPYSQGTDFVIGSHGAYKTGYDFTGNMDEVECAGVARSPDWIRLCYVSQKVTDALVKFEH
jgi:hypothetical protein